MKTIRLFDADSYIQEFQATVLFCEALEKDQYGIVLDRTAFFPEGGGQAGDNGWLEEIPVSDTYERDGYIYHRTGAPLEEGTRVKGKVDFKERFDKMQQHTGEHILCGIVHKLYGYENVGFHLGTEITTMDFNGELTQEQLDNVQFLANQAIFENHAVTAHYPSREELEDLEYRSKLELEDGIRIVEIEEIDRCACCVPHVRSTAEVGILKIVNYEKHRGGSRLTILCGMRAFQDYHRRQEIAKRISETLSARQDQIDEAVEQLKSRQQSLREQLNSVQARYLQEKLERICEDDRYVLIFEEEIDSIALRNFVNSAMERFEGICGAFSGSDGKGYQYIIGSRGSDARKISKKLNDCFLGKGGGKAQMVQGSLYGTKEEIMVVFEKLKGDFLEKI